MITTVWHRDPLPARSLLNVVVWCAVVLVALLAVLVMVGCGSDSPTTPTPVVPACQSQNTAQLRFENNSSSRFTYDVYVDNAVVATIAPTVVSQPVTVVAGVQHQVRFLLTNTAILACVVSPIPVQCSQTNYFCTF